MKKKNNENPNIPEDIYGTEVGGTSSTENNSVNEAGSDKDPERDGYESDSLSGSGITYYDENGVRRYKAKHLVENEYKNVQFAERKVGRYRIAIAAAVIGVVLGASGIGVAGKYIYDYNKLKDEKTNSSANKPDPKKGDSIDKDSNDTGSTPVPGLGDKDPKKIDGKELTPEQKKKIQEMMAQEAKNKDKKGDSDSTGSTDDTNLPGGLPGAGEAGAGVEDLDPEKLEKLKEMMKNSSGDGADGSGAIGDLNALDGLEGDTAGVVAQDETLPKVVQEKMKQLQESDDFLDTSINKITKINKSGDQQQIAELNGKSVFSLAYIKEIKSVGGVNTAILTSGPDGSGDAAECVINPSSNIDELKALNPKQLIAFEGTYSTFSEVPKFTQCFMVSA